VPVSRTVGTMARSPLATSRELEPFTASLPRLGSASSNAQAASSSGKGLLHGATICPHRAHPPW
jgi:hypothetical protein